MSRPAAPWTLAVVLSAALLTACTSKLVFRYADWYLLWKIDHYVDLSAPQKLHVHGRVKDLLSRHQREALPVYEQALTDVRRKVADGLSRDDVDWITERFHQLRADLVDRVLPDGAVLLVSINEGQRRHLQRMLGKDNEKASREVADAPEVRQIRRISHALDLLKDWLGPLTREQEQRVRELVPTLPDLDRNRLSYVEEREQELFGLLRSQGDSQLIRDRLRLWILDPERIAPAYAQSRQQFIERLKQIALAIDPLVTPAQRARALHRLDALIHDIHALRTS